MTVLYQKGTKLECLECHDHILTFKHDAHIGECFSEALISQDEGQAPWRSGESCNCKKCHARWFDGFIFRCKIILPNMEGRNEKAIYGNDGDSRTNSESTFRY